MNTPGFPTANPRTPSRRARTLARLALAALGLICVALGTSLWLLAGRVERIEQWTEPWDRTPPELRAELEELRATLQPPDAAGDPWAACLHARVDYAEWRLKASSRQWSAAACDRIAGLVRDIRDACAAQNRGALLPADRTKPFLCGFWSRIDDTVQPFWVALPKGYDPDRAYPLVVQLHGQGLFRPFQGRARRIGDRIVIAPHGRGGMDYKWIGEVDVLQAVDAAKRLFRIDPSRAYCVGHSMGGTGAWHLATRHPDAFAAIVAACGNTDIRVWAEQWHWRTPAESPQAAVRDFLRQDTSAVPYAENLLHLHVVALQGEADPVVHPQHAERMAEALSRAGHPSAVFHLLPLVTHGFGVDMDRALASNPARRKPADVVYRTAWLKHDGAAWLRIRGIGQRLRFARVEGHAAPHAIPFTIETQNVTALLLKPEASPVSGPIRRIAIDQTPVDVDPHKRLLFRKDPERGWIQSSPRQDASRFPPPKSPTVEGPLEHVYTARFLLVAPTAASATARAARRACERFCGFWEQRFGARPRQTDDQHVREQDVRQSHLVLYGTPADNTWTARVIDRLPLSFAPDGEIGLAERRYRGPHAGVKLCYPNPLNPARYVAIIAGTTPESYADIGVRFGNWFDWIPYDYRDHFDYAVFDDRTVGRAPETFLTWGFFGEAWSLADGQRFDGAPDWRRRVKPRIHPVHAQPPAGRSGVYLDTVCAVRTELHKECLERNRDLDGDPLHLAGEPVERGLAFRFPGRITFANAGYKRFRASVGIEWDGRSMRCPDAEHVERAVFVVKEGGEELYRSKPRQYRHSPLPVSVGLSGDKDITLEVAGGRVWLNGTAVWASARLE